jgi:hypothetical protein
MPATDVALPTSYNRSYNLRLLANQKCYDFVARRLFLSLIVMHMDCIRQCSCAYLMLKYNKVGSVMKLVDRNGWQRAPIITIIASVEICGGVLKFRCASLVP